MAPSPIVSDRLGSHRRLLLGIALVGFALPAAAYLWFIHQYGVNVPRLDQWSDIALIGRSYSGTLGFSDLWAAHNDHRIFFPNLLAVLQGRITHLNLFVEMYLSALLLFVAIGLLIATHKRRSPSTGWVFYCPVAIVMLSFAQYQDMLWGFQVAWYIVIAALAAVLFLLDRPTLNWRALSVAIALAIVGSYSLFQGLLIWPVGLLLMVQRRRCQQAILAWVISAALTGIAYFVGLQPPPNRFYVLHHPGAAIKLLFLAIGDIFAQSTPVAGDNAILVFGVAMFLLAMWVIVRYGLRRDETSARPVGVALICFGLLFVASADIGTAWVLGPWVGTNSLYVINVLLILVGSYLVVLNWPASTGSRAGAVVHQLVPLGVVIVIAVQVVLGTTNGLSGGKTTHRSALEAADVVVNMVHASKPEIRSAFACPYIGNGVGLPRWSPWCPGGSLSPTSVAVVRSHRLALFGTSAATSFAKEGLVFAPEFLVFAKRDVNWALGATGQAMRYVVQATGSPPPALSSRDLPRWLELVDDHNGTAVLSASDPPRGTTQFVVRAVNRAGEVDQPFALFVKDRKDPAFGSPDNKTCFVDTPCNMEIRATGWPTPVITERGPLPKGMVFKLTRKGALLSGRVSNAVARTYPVTVSASTGLGSPAVQTIAITVR
jgi:hypothetical protein